LPNSPALISSINIGAQPSTRAFLVPNPSVAENVSLFLPDGISDFDLVWYNTNGQQLIGLNRSYQATGRNEYIKLDAPTVPGFYYVRIIEKSGKSSTINIILK
jgi:hypothetical protein